MKTVTMCLAVVLMTAIGVAESSAQAPKKQARAMAPYLGISTRYPTAREAQTMALPRGVRTRGQIITAVAKDSPAENAGLEAGDVLLKLDDNGLYSFDDIRDFIATSKPGRRVKASVKRGTPLKLQELGLIIGKRPLSKEEAKKPSFTWDYASLAQLETAQKHAKKEGKLILVGICGAET